MKTEGIQNRDQNILLRVISTISYRLYNFDYNFDSFFCRCQLTKLEERTQPIPPPLPPQSKPNILRKQMSTSAIHHKYRLQNLHNDGRTAMLKRRPKSTPCIMNFNTHSSSNGLESSTTPLVMIGKKIQP